MKLDKLLEMDDIQKEQFKQKAREAKVKLLAEHHAFKVVTKHFPIK